MYEREEQEHNEDVTPKARRWQTVLLPLFGLVLLVLLTLHVLSLNGAPELFPVATPVVVVEGASVAEITDTLYEQHVIRSKFFFFVYYSLFHRNEHLQAGTYEFEERRTTTKVITSLTKGLELAPPITITIPEGLRGEQIVTIVEDMLPGATASNTASFYDAYIGFLFPDTYFVPGTATEADLLRLMRENYEKKIAPRREDIGHSALTEEETIILASLVEREANSPQSMRTVADILLARLDLGMPLQVDASFEYLFGKTSDELTGEDLAVDSPYNTYTNSGLPPTPIANPGLLAIEAVLYAEETEYLYYLTAPDGMFYYAKTFEEHKRNKDRYLR